VWQRVAAFVVTIPNYVWLAMFLLAALMLAGGTMLRSRAQVQVAANAHAVTSARLAAANSENAALKERTTLLRNNLRAAAQVAQEQLHQVRANEIVIATK
jgi:cell division protein FtsB